MDNSNQPISSGSINDDNGKLVAVISYLSLIGWIIAYVMFDSKKTHLAAFHLRQTITLYILSIGVWFLQMVLLDVSFVGVMIAGLAMVLYLGLFILWLIGLIAAINGEEKLIPLIGKKGQEWFKGIKA